MEDWADNTTVLSGMSDPELEPAMTDQNLDYQTSLGFQVRRFSGHYSTILLSVLSFLSSILMIILPHTSIFNLRLAMLLFRNAQLKFVGNVVV